MRGKFHLTCNSLLDFLIISCVNSGGVVLSFHISSQIPHEKIAQLQKQLWHWRETWTTI